MKKGLGIALLCLISNAHADNICDLNVSSVCSFAILSNPGPGQHPTDATDVPFENHTSFTTTVGPVESSGTVHSALYSDNITYVGDAPPPTVSNSGGVQLGSTVATGNARAQTDIGVNRAGSSISSTTSGQFSVASDIANGISVWKDQLDVSGTGPTPITINGTVSGQLVSGSSFAYGLFASTGGPFLSSINPLDTNGQNDSANFLGGISMGASSEVDPAGSGALVIRKTNFADLPGTTILAPKIGTSPNGRSIYDVKVPWSTTVTVDGDRKLSLLSELNASTLLLVLGSGAGETDSAADFFSTAKIDSITAPEGVTLTSESGDLVLLDGQYVFVSVVPIPNSSIMLLSGLGLLAIAFRKRRQQNVLAFLSS